MANLFEELRGFVRVAELGNFSRAARDLRMSQSSVSRLVAELERRLEVKLLLRSTHEVGLTDAGLTYLDHARGILERVEQATEAVRLADSLDGVLRVATPATFGTRTVIPMLTAFLREHPKLKIELAPLDQTQPLISQAVDVAIRFGRLPDSDFGMRRLATLARVAVASPAYLAERGMPAEPAQLAGHDGLFGPGLTGRASWLFDGHAMPPGGLIERVSVTTAEGVIACALAGLGIAVATRALCRDDIAAGRLVEILSNHPLQPVDLHAVFPSGRKPSKKARALVDHLVQALARQDI